MQWKLKCVDLMCGQSPRVLLYTYLSNLCNTLWKTACILSLILIGKLRLRILYNMPDSQIGYMAERELKSRHFSLRVQCFLHYHKVIFISSIPLSLEHIALQMSCQYLRTGSSITFLWYYSTITITELSHAVIIVYMSVLIIKLVSQGIRLCFIHLCISMSSRTLETKQPKQEAKRF